MSVLFPLFLKLLYCYFLLYELYCSHHWIQGFTDGSWTSKEGCLLNFKINCLNVMYCFLADHSVTRRIPKTQVNNIVAAAHIVLPTYTVCLKVRIVPFLFQGLWYRCCCRIYPQLSGVRRRGSKNAETGKRLKGAKWELAHKCRRLFSYCVLQRCTEMHR